MKHKLIFNTSLEIGLRSMFLLSSLYPLKVNLDRLLYFDYLTIYTQDAELKIESLHPEYAMRIIELFSKREILKKALMRMTSKGLITIECGEEGFNYCANSNTNWFLEGLKDDEYSKELIKRTKAITEAFKNYSDEELRIFLEKSIESKQKKFNNFFPYMERGV
jgi:hypothetical protein